MIQFLTICMRLGSDYWLNLVALWQAWFLDCKKSSPTPDERFGFQDEQRIAPTPTVGRHLMETQSRRLGESKRSTAEAQSMCIVAIARIIAVAVAMFAAVLGVCMLGAAANSLLYLELPDAHDCGRIAVGGASGLMLIGYAAAHSALCLWPQSVRALAARAAFTVAAGVSVALAVRSALNAPQSPGCGMKWLADLVPFVFAVGVATVEAAAWAGWRADATTQSEPGASPDPAT